MSASNNNRYGMDPGLLQNARDILRCDLGLMYNELHLTDPRATLEKLRDLLRPSFLRHRGETESAILEFVASMDLTDLNHNLDCIYFILTWLDFSYQIEPDVSVSTADLLAMEYVCTMMGMLYDVKAVAENIFNQQARSSASRSDQIQRCFDKFIGIASNRDWNAKASSTAMTEIFGMSVRPETFSFFDHMRSFFSPDRCLRAVMETGAIPRFGDLIRASVEATKADGRLVLSRDITPSIANVVLRFIDMISEEYYYFSSEISLEEIHFYKHFVAALSSILVQFTNSACPLYASLVNCGESLLKSLEEMRKFRIMFISEEGFETAAIVHSERIFLAAVDSCKALSASVSRVRDTRGLDKKNSEINPSADQHSNLISHRRNKPNFKILSGCKIIFRAPCIGKWFKCH